MSPKQTFKFYTWGKLQKCFIYVNMLDDTLGNQLLNKFRLEGMLLGMKTQQLSIRVSLSLNYVLQKQASCKHKLMTNV